MQKASIHSDSAKHIAVVQETTIRRVWHKEACWFALSDVIVMLTDSSDPGTYQKDAQP